MQQAECDKYSDIFNSILFLRGKKTLQDGGNIYSGRSFGLLCAAAVTPPQRVRMLFCGDVKKKKEKKKMFLKSSLKRDI